MAIRVYEFAKKLDVSSGEVLEMVSQLGFTTVTSHMSNLSDEQAEAVQAGLRVEAEVVKFDKGTGRGEVVVKSPAMQSYQFDLKSTRLENKKFSPMRVGKTVRIAVDGPDVKSIAVEP